VTHTFAAEIVLSDAVDASAWFRAEGLLDRAAQLLWRTEPQAGDPLFDQLVFVGQAGGSMLPRLLAHEGVQCALMELVPHTPVELTGASLRFDISWNDDFDDDYPDPMEMVVSLALLAVHLERMRQPATARR
jgi:hypothetical protein